MRTQTLSRSEIDQLGWTVGTTGLYLLSWDGVATLRNELGDEVGYFCYDRPGAHSSDVGIVPSKTIYIRHAEIFEKYRNRGYASAALNTLEAIFASEGFQTVWTLSLTIRISFFEKLGFTRHHKTPTDAYGPNVDTHIWAKQIKRSNR
ncbi:MAG: GNAT family N-acetyltransferase [Nitrososphaerota archaeon]|nr:GNAT family N-acetyltransferase [Nitrososphaerota archaeon]